jgi:hypothetical protein
MIGEVVVHRTRAADLRNAFSAEEDIGVLRCTGNIALNQRVRTCTAPVQSSTRLLYPLTIAIVREGSSPARGKPILGIPGVYPAVPEIAGSVVSVATQLVLIAGRSFVQRPVVRLADNGLHVGEIAPPVVDIPIAPDVPVRPCRAQTVQSVIAEDLGSIVIKVVGDLLHVSVVQRAVGVAEVHELATRLLRAVQKSWSRLSVSLYFPRVFCDALAPIFSLVKASIACSIETGWSSCIGFRRAAASNCASSRRFSSSARAQDLVFALLRTCFPFQLQRRCLRQLQRRQNSSPIRGQLAVWRTKIVIEGMTGTRLAPG